MILPNNGKVVIIDDEYKDVKELIRALTKEKMPFLFFQDVGGDDLPEDGPIDDVRLVFLDLDLGLGGNNPTENVRLVQGRLARILKPKTPYVLAIWSTYEDQYAKLLLEEFEGDFHEFKPIACCSLDKEQTLKEENIVSAIRSKLKKSLNGFDAFNAFLLWESIVSKSSGEIVNGFTQIFKLDDSWDNNVRAFLHRLAKANVGQAKIEVINDNQKLQLALETITSALSDSIEKNIKLGVDKLDIKVEEKGANITADHLIAINTKLHLIDSDGLDHFLPGNIYIPEVTDEEMVYDIVSNALNKKKTDEIIKSKPIVIKIDVTPVCDYAQDKGYTRLLSGILVKKEYYCQRGKLFIYDLCPVIKILGEEYYPIFDFRYFKSIKQESVQKYFPKPTSRIRSQLLIDLQSGLSNHINRPGIVSIV